MKNQNDNNNNNNNNNNNIYKRYVFYKRYADDIFVIQIWFSLHIITRFNLVFDMSKVHLEVAKLKEILLKNGYPRKIIDACVFKFLNKFFEPKPATLTVPKKQLFFVLPFMGNMSGVIKTGLSKALQKRLPFCKLQVIFKSTNCLKSYFNFKDVLPEPLRSCQIYKFTIESCSASYTGKTFRHLKVRVSEHQSVSPQTGKVVEGTLSTSVRDHMLECDHIVVWDDFKVLGRESNHWLLEIKESLFIKRDKPSLNKNINSQKCFYFHLRFVSSTFIAHCFAKFEYLIVNCFELMVSF